MKQTVKLNKVVEEIIDIYCNKCGQSCKVSQFQDKSYFSGLNEVEVVGGYESTFIDDGDVYRFSLCERCCKELVDSFKIDAKVGNYFFPEDKSENFDRHNYFATGTKLYEDFSDKEKEQLKTSLTSFDWIIDVSRDELIIWLYDLENNNLGIEDRPKEEIFKNKIKEALASKKKNKQGE